MASLALRSGNAFVKGVGGEDLYRKRRKSRHASFPCSLESRKRRSTVVSASIFSARANADEEPRVPVIMNQAICEAGGDRDRKRDPVVNSDWLDQWISHSITEIVRNIGEAPFLVYVYSEGENGYPVRVTREKAMEDQWPRISARWSKENRNSTPEGVILVQQLDRSPLLHQEEEDHNDGQPLCEVVRKNSEAEVNPCSLCSGLWGILIQGRGLDCSACYILETTRVRSSIGFSTHFCLVRAKCFGQLAELQLRDSWLASPSS